MNEASASGTVTLHAAARLEQVLAVLELAIGCRERHLQRRQLHDAVELAIRELADDASGGGSHYDEHCEARDSDFYWSFHCDPGCDGAQYSLFWNCTAIRCCDGRVALSHDDTSNSQLLTMLRVAERSSRL